MGRTVVCGAFEWDEEKNAANIRKHGISFEAILPMFDDPLYMERYDWQNSTLEESRYLGVGWVEGFFIIASCYTDRDGRIRIINARRASSEEKRDYERRYKGFFHT